MKRKPYFIESKAETFDSTICDKCGLPINSVQDGQCFWNPNPNAIDRNICRNCFEVWQWKRKEKFRRWANAHAEIKDAANADSAENTID